MKVRLTDIPKDGLKISDTISLEALNQRMSEGKKNDVEFLVAPTAEVHIHLQRDSIAHGALLSGTVSSQYQEPCPRCLNMLHGTLQEDLSLILKPVGSTPHSEDDEVDGVGILYFEGEHLELEDVLQETLILAISPYGLEHPECPGIIEHELEKDDSQSSTLGALLNRALADEKK